MGHCTVAKVWRKKEDSAYELNIAAEVLNYPIEETLDTLLHEMVHLYCRENGIKEVSRGGKYHNKRFKMEDRLIQYALDKGFSEITLGRSTLLPMRTGAAGTPQAGAGNVPGGKRPSSTRKLVCPCCGLSVRATKKVNILCGDCMQKMEEAG